MEQWEVIQKQKEAYRNYLLTRQWQWFASLNFKKGTDCPGAEKLIRSWSFNMGTRDHILIAYMGVFNYINNPHVHLLVWGKCNRKRQTLLDLYHKAWEKEWNRITKCSCVIEAVDYTEGVATYIAKKNLPWERSELITPHPNKRLLNKARIKSNEQDENPDVHFPSMLYKLDKELIYNP